MKSFREILDEKMESESTSLERFPFEVAEIHTADTLFDKLSRPQISPQAKAMQFQTYGVTQALKTASEPTTRPEDLKVKVSKWSGRERWDLHLFFNLLGLESPAEISLNQLKFHYKSGVKKFHPDRFSEGEDQFIQLKNLFDILETLIKDSVFPSVKAPKAA